MKKFIFILLLQFVAYCLYSQSYSIKYRETLRYSMRLKEKMPNNGNNKNNMNVMSNNNNYMEQTLFPIP